MDFLRRFFLKLRKIYFQVKPLSPSGFVFYKIISKSKKKLYILQCLYSKSIFYASISELINNKFLLYRLHPLQACFLGIEYAAYLRTQPSEKRYKIKPSELEDDNNLDHVTFELKYQDRTGNLYYINLHTKEEFINSAKELAFSDQLISKFHPEQAFYIGICAGLKIHAPIKNIIYFNKSEDSTSPREIELDEYQN